MTDLTSTEAIKKIGDFMGAWEEFKATNDARLKEMEKRGTADVLFGEKLQGIEKTLASFEKLNNDVTLAAGRIQAIEDAAKSINENMERIEAKLNRANLGTGGDLDPSVAKKRKEYKGAWLEYCRKSERSVSQGSLDILNAYAAEYKALVAGQDVLGGYYLAPPEFELEIIKAVILMSPLRALARVSKIGVPSLKIPKRTGVFGASRVAEQAARNESFGYATGMVEITAPELFALSIISMQMLEDSAFDIEAEMRGEFVEQFAVTEGKEFIAGTGGAEQAEGVLTNAQVNVVHSGLATNLNGDSLINLFYNGLKTAYARNATWIMKRQTLGAIRQLKDGQGNYLWLPGIATLQPNTILGAPYAEMPDMPDIGAGTYPIMVGDFQRAYRVVDRLELGVLRDPYTGAGSGQVKLWARKRVGGGVTLGEALAKLLIAA
jgi:HK97 family phage major capsid protein